MMYSLASNLPRFQDFLRLADLSRVASGFQNPRKKLPHKYFIGLGDIQGNQILDILRTMRQKLHCDQILPASSIDGQATTLIHENSTFFPTVRQRIFPDFDVAVKPACRKA